MNTVYLANLTNLLKPFVQIGQDWKLCWRASEDGWHSKRFHFLCDGKGATITIVKVGNYIFGGYTSISWGKFRHRPYLQGSPSAEAMSARTTNENFDYPSLSWSRDFDFHTDTDTKVGNWKVRHLGKVEKTLYLTCTQAKPKIYRRLL